MPLYDVSISVLLYVKTYTGWDACVQKKTSLLSRLEFQFYKQFQEAEIIPGSKMVPHSISYSNAVISVTFHWFPAYNNDMAWKLFTGMAKDFLIFMWHKLW